MCLSPVRFCRVGWASSATANAILLAKPASDANEKLSAGLTLADWGLKLLSPDDRARDLVKFLDPRNEDGKLKKLKWLGRIPDDLAKKADGGVLTLDAIKAWYGKHRRYCRACIASSFT